MMQIELITAVCLIALAGSSLALDDESGMDGLTLGDGYDYSLANSKAIEMFDLHRDKVCTAPGHMCKTCTTRVNCVEVSPGVFEENGAHTCLSNETCKTTECEVGRNPPCEPVAQLKFECRHIGMFPDQFNCQRLHMCAPSSGSFIDYLIQCGANYSYNPLTMYCDTLLQPDGSCYIPGREPEWPVPPCEEGGQMGAIIDNKSIYYVCEAYGTTGILYPFLRLCPNGGLFNDETMVCDPKPPPAEGPGDAYFDWLRHTQNFNF